MAIPMRETPCCTGVDEPGLAVIGGDGGEGDSMAIPLRGGPCCAGVDEPPGLGFNIDGNVWIECSMAIPIGGRPCCCGVDEPGLGVIDGNGGKEYPKGIPIFGGPCCSEVDELELRSGFLLPNHSLVSAMVSAPALWEIRELPAVLVGTFVEECCYRIDVGGACNDGMGSVVEIERLTDQCPKGVACA